METSGINQVNFNGRVTARVIDRAGMDLGDSHNVCSDNKLGGRREIFEVFNGIGVKKQKKFAELVSELSGPSELWWGALRWGGSSEAGGRLTDNSIGVENPSFSPVHIQTHIPIRSFQSLHRYNASCSHGLYVYALRQLVSSR